MNMTIRTPLLLLMLALAIAGCGKNEAGAKAGSQVIAKVNGNEISVHQLNFQLARLQGVNESQLKDASRKVLSQLVDQQLMMQKAVDTKLDRDPKVLQAVEAAKAEILARAYLDSQLSAAKKPTKQQMDAFYTEHPELFEKRRIYRLQELVITADREKHAAIQEGIKTARNINEVGEWLTKNGYKFTANANVRPAEQLPMQLLPRLQQMKNGEVVLVPSDHALNIVLLVDSQDQSVSREQASPPIEQYFLNLDKSKITQSTLENIRKEAKVEYLGDFADMKTAAVQEASKPAPSVEAKAAVAAPAKANPPAADSDHISKGLSGL